MGRWVKYERKAAACPARAIRRSNGDVCGGESKWSCKHANMIPEHNLLGCLHTHCRYIGARHSTINIPRERCRSRLSGDSHWLWVCRGRVDGSIQNAGLAASSPPGQVRLRLLAAWKQTPQKLRTREQSFCANAKYLQVLLQHMRRSLHCYATHGPAQAMARCLASNHTKTPDKASSKLAWGSRY